MAAVVATAIGLLATILVSAYYFRKSRRTALAVQVYSLETLYDLDEALTGNVRVHVGRRRLVQPVLLGIRVTNEGANPIDTTMGRLQLHLPSRANVVRAAVVEVRPAGREVRLAAEGGADGTAIELDFRPLNPEEAFAVEFLLDGWICADEIRASIQADHLPPELPVTIVRTRSTLLPTGRNTLALTVLAAIPASASLVVTGWTFLDLHGVWPFPSYGDPPSAWEALTDYGVLLLGVMTAVGLISLSSIIPPKDDPVFPRLVAAVRRHWAGGVSARSAGKKASTPAG